MNESTETNYIADAIAAENVRNYLDGLLKNPLPGTLAHRVAYHGVLGVIRRWIRG